MLKAINKKTMLAAAVAGLAVFGMVNANAAVSGAYIGGQLGYGNVHQGNFSNSTFPGATITKNSSTDSGLAGRVFGGYQFNPNFAAEMGYTRFHNATATQNATLATTKFAASSNIKTDAIDLVGKGILPLQYGFSLYGKLGVAYLRDSGSQNQTSKIGTTTLAKSSSSLDAKHLYPTFGAGVSYDITSNLSADVSWNHIQKVGSNSKLANTDFAGAGLAYNFG